MPLQPYHRCEQVQHVVEIEAGKSRISFVAAGRQRSIYPLGKYLGSQHAGASSYTQRHSPGADTAVTQPDTDTDKKKLVTAVSQK